MIIVENSSVDALERLQRVEHPVVSKRDLELQQNKENPTNRCINIFITHIITNEETIATVVILQEAFKVRQPFATSFSLSSVLNFHNN